MQGQVKTAKKIKNIEVEDKSMDDIEQSLIKGSVKAYCGIDDFERIFEKKKLIGDAIDQFRNKNKNAKNSISLMQQRLVQIEQLADKAEKQSVLLRNQIDKINDAHTMTKILTIQRMIKAKMQHDQLQKKKDTIFRIRQDRHRASLLNRSRDEYRTEKIRQLSMIDNKNLQNAYIQRKNQTIEIKWSRAQKVREEKQRRKDRLKRYQQFKVDQAKKNYLDKMQNLKETLEDRQKRLDGLYREQLKQERNYETTQQVTKQYLGSMFPTETI